jgi:hypothetical protein
MTLLPRVGGRNYPEPMTAAKMGAEAELNAEAVKLNVDYACDRIAWALKEAVEQARTLTALEAEVPPEIRQGLAWVEREFYPAYRRLAGQIRAAP